MRERSRCVIVRLPAIAAAIATKAASPSRLPASEACVSVALARSASAKAMPAVVEMRLRPSVRHVSDRLAWSARERRAAPLSLEAWLRSRSVSAHCARAHDQSPRESRAREQREMREGRSTHVWRGLLMGGVCTL